MASFRLVFILIFIPALCHAQGKFEFERIEDNSFLVEEAYNQEPSVIQHISAFQLLQDKTWLYTFTEEWPLKGQKHQISFTLPVLNTGTAGLGDIALNYRYQAVLSERLGFSPRFSLLLPTGNSGQRHGNAVPGYQVNLPVSFLVSRKIVTHYNFGTTLIFSARMPDNNRSDITNFNYGGSIIYLLSPNFNFMLEIAGNTIRTRPVNSRMITENSLYINPGFRFAINFNSGLQIVPGLSFPVSIGRGSGSNGIFFYLSFEHPLH